MVYCRNYPSPVGNLLLESDGSSLTGLYIGRFAEENDALPVFSKTERWLEDYFSGNHRTIDIPLSPAGTDFQRQVWKLLLKIPYGMARTYGSLAREMAEERGKEKMSAQAIGGAVGRNPISILIPCHRVVGAKGKLTGYAWGIDKKAWLLRHEGWISDGSSIL